MRQYEQSHPWMTFTVNLSKAPANLWVSLGECNILCNSISQIPLSQDTRQSLEKSAMARGILASKKYGRFTLDEGQMVKFFENKLELSSSKRYLAQEIENMAEGMRTAGIFSNLAEDNPLTVDMIKAFNRIVLDKLVLSKDMEPGGFRTSAENTAASSITSVPAEDCEYLVEQLCKWLSGSTFNPGTKMTVIYGILKTVIAHLYLKWIMPFRDGNHRTIAMVDYYLLLSSGVPAPAAHLMDIFFADTISEYEYQLRLVGEKDGKIQLFLMYAVRGLKDSLEGLMKELNSRLTDNLWESMIKDKFGDKTSSSDQRKCRLALELSKIPEPVPVSKICEIIPWAAAAYAGKTYKTLTRDAADIVDQGLFEKTDKGISARKILITSFRK